MTRLARMRLALPLALALCPSPAFGEDAPTSASGHAPNQAPGETPMNDPDASVPALPLENAPLIDSDIGWFVAGTAVVLGVGLIANGLLAECPEGKSCPADSRLLLGAGVAAAGTALGIVFLAGDAEPGQEEPPIVALRVSGPF